MPDLGTAHWFGVLNYLTYTFTPRVSGTARLEFFDDEQGQRTGFAGLYTAATAGVSFKPRPAVILRPELRYDYNGESRPFENRHGLVHRDGGPDLSLVARAEACDVQRRRRPAPRAICTNGPAFCTHRPAAGQVQEWSLSPEVPVVKRLEGYLTLRARILLPRFDPESSLSPGGESNDPADTRVGRLDGPGFPGTGLADAAKQRQPADAGVLPLRALAPPSLAPGRVAGPATASEFVVTEQTEVLLDGKACRYADVPARATVLRMEVAPDGKTVLRIQFRTGR